MKIDINYLVMNIIRKENIIKIKRIKSIMFIMVIIVLLTACVKEDEPVYTELFIKGSSLSEVKTEEKTFVSYCGAFSYTFSIPLSGEITGNHYAYSLYIEGVFDIEIILIQHEGSTILASWEDVGSYGIDNPVTGEQFSVDPYTLRGDTLQLRLGSTGGSCIIHSCNYDSKIFVPEFQ